MANIQAATSELRWYQKAETAAAIVCVATLMLFIGAEVIPLSTPRSDDFSDLSIYRSIWDQLGVADNVCSVGLGFISISFLACCVGACLSDVSRNKKSQLESRFGKLQQIDGQQHGKRWKKVTLISGIAVTCLGLAIMISAFLVLNTKTLSDMQSMIEDGIKHSDKSAEWMRLKTEWLTPMITKLTLLVKVGKIMAITGSGLLILGGIAYFREKVKARKIPTGEP